MTMHHFTPIHSVLVANRGEIARRVFRTCREQAIATVAVFSDADEQAMFAREADIAVRLPGTSSADTYLRGDLVVAAAVRAGATAVHPGYGFLSENAAFAQQVLDAGLIWVGPPPAAIAAMGSKIEAKKLMRSHGVPVAPDNTVESLGEVGLPALVKASAGGGGRGMRIVRTSDELADAIASAEREALAEPHEAAVHPVVPLGLPGLVCAAAPRDHGIDRMHREALGRAAAGNAISVERRVDGPDHEEVPMDLPDATGAADAVPHDPRGPAHPDGARDVRVGRGATPAGRSRREQQHRAEEHLGSSSTVSHQDRDDRTAHLIRSPAADDAPCSHVAASPGTAATASRHAASAR